MSSREGTGHQQSSQLLLASGRRRWSGWCSRSGGSVGGGGDRGRGSVLLVLVQLLSTVSSRGVGVLGQFWGNIHSSLFLECRLWKSKML